MLSIFKNINFKDSVSSITPCDVLLFCHDADRGVTLNQLPYSPLMDSLGDELKARGYRCQSVSLPWSKLTGSLAHNHPIAYNRSYFWALLQNKLSKQPGQQSLVSLYEKILTLARPKLVLTIGCENALCEAAHRLDIFHVELLHGIGYATITWGWEHKDPKHLPAGILSLDATSTKTFSALTSKGLEINEIPHPFLRRFHGSHNIELPKEWLPASKKKTTGQLFLLQSKNNRAVVPSFKQEQQGSCSFFKARTTGQLFLLQSKNNRAVVPSSKQQ